MYQIKHSFVALQKLFALLFAKCMIIDAFNKYISHGSISTNLQRRLHWLEGKPTAEHLALLVLIFFKDCHVTFQQKKRSWVLIIRSQYGITYLLAYSMEQSPS
jgi:hypothetical protein